MSDLDDRTACECCEDGSAIVPARHENRPGLPEIRFRVGTHGGFKATMLAEISRKGALKALGRRTNDDLTIALIDAWAMTLDVLTFYQERIANESYLGTATERRSMVELARLIGYELRPGLAAAVLLAFLLDSSEGSPLHVAIPAGTPAQSIPAKEEVPQTFETSEQLRAVPRFNQLRPRLTHPQEFDAGTRRFWVKGTTANLKPGDPMLLVTGASGDFQELLRVVAVDLDAANARTRVDLALDPDPGAGYRLPQFTKTLLNSLSFGELGESLVSGVFDAATITGSLQLSGTPIEVLIDALNSRRNAPVTPAAAGLYALRASAAPFGHNAPRYRTTPKEWRPTSEEGTSSDPPYPYNWDDGWPVTEDSQSTPWGPGVRTVALERELKEIGTGGWMVLESETLPSRVYRVEDAVTRSVADFGLTGRSTLVTLIQAPGGPPTSEVSDFLLRETAFHAASEQLELADLPIETLDAGTLTIELEEIVPDIPPGRTLILEGLRAGEFEGVAGTEPLEVGEVYQGLFTSLNLVKPLAFTYRRDTVQIYANVIEATHGQTQAEVLGSGDASRSFQLFTLRQNPLTYVSAAESPSGGAAELEVRVNDLRWREVPSLYALNPKDRGYAVRLDDEGRTDIEFGDGVHGARLPSGLENVQALYRSGLGPAGLVGANRITLLPRKLLGVREVTNPLPSGGAQAPQTLQSTRRNAPLTIRTLDRIVSLADFEDFAATFSGIDKARAAWVWDGSRRVIHVTVAGPDGVSPVDQVLKNLLASMQRARVPHIPRQVAPFQRLRFSLVALIKIDPDFNQQSLLKAAEAALRSRFTFDAREFAQRASIGEVIASLERVDGVLAVDLDSMQYEVSGGGNSADEFGLPAQGARFDRASGTILPAQLLTITDQPLDLRVML